MLSHDWLCGRVDVPATPLMTPDVLDMSGSHVGTALRVAMNAYHKAARTGFTLMDVSNAPLAKRRKKKNFSSESQKGSDDSSETSESRSDYETISKNPTSLAVPDRRECKIQLPVDRDSTQSKIPALAVCLSPSVSRQSIIDTIATNREPPPLRPISGDCESILSGNSSSSTESNFFFKEFKDSCSAQVFSHSQDGLPSLSSRHYMKDTASRNRKQQHSIEGQTNYDISHGPYAHVNREVPTQSQFGESRVVIQNARGRGQYTASAPHHLAAKQQKTTTASDVMNNNILDIALSGLRDGNRAWKRPYQP